MTGGAGSVEHSAARREPLRILMVAARYFPFVGGTETHVHEVGMRLATMGHAVAVLTSDPTGRHPAREDAAGMQIVRVRAWPERSDLHFSPGICADILKGRWEIIHIQGYHTCVAPLGMIGALCRSIPFVVTFHSGGHSSAFRRRLRRVQHVLLRPLVARASRLIAVSDFEADYFSRHMRLDRERFSVVPNGAQLPVADAHAGKSEGSCLIVSVGRLERYKGHHKVIAALPHLLERIPQAHLRVAGEGPYEGELRALTHRLGLASRVTISGIPAGDRKAMAALLSSASLVVLLSEYEAHPVAILEGLSLGRPALVTSTAGLAELAERGLAAAVSLQATAAEIADAMAAEIGAKRRDAEVSLPNWDDCTSQLLNIYQSAIRGARSSGAGAAARC